jgi:hypothetical protein
VAMRVWIGMTWGVGLSLGCTPLECDTSTLGESAECASDSGATSESPEDTGETSEDTGETSEDTGETSEDTGEMPDFWSVRFTNCEGGWTPWGPTSEDCAAAYTSTTLDGAVSVVSGKQTWTVEETATYYIAAQGASGGVSYRIDPCEGTDCPRGGHGAFTCGAFELAEGSTLQVAVGHPGGSGFYDGGGGGGTFVTDGEDTPLLVAGGGGGVMGLSGQGCDGSASPYGTVASDLWAPVLSRCGERETAPGSGGTTATCGAAGGGGFFGNGGECGDWSEPLARGGKSWPSGLEGGWGEVTYSGGFGGGGSGGSLSSAGAGGGGGYSGGNGGQVSGGGGTFNSGSDPVTIAGLGDDTLIGWVVIRRDGCELPEGYVSPDSDPSSP